MNFRFDVIVIGDSKSGHNIIDKLATSRQNIKIAFISKAFKSTTSHDYLNVKYFRDEVEYLNYRYRLFSCHMKNGDCIFSTHVVIASGLDYKPLMVNNKPVQMAFNSTDDIPNTVNDQTSLVIYNQDSDVKLAIEAAKKYKHVYLCTKELELAKHISQAAAKKLAKSENITILPNTSIKNIICDESSALNKVEFDNYSEIMCSAILVKTDSKPAVNYIPRKIICREEDNYLVVNDNCESTLVPKCFAAGSCLKKYTKAMEQKLIESILKDF